ncbi:MAG: site-2 protease family protein [Alphaproteobacteria bacterium]
MSDPQVDSATTDAVIRPVETDPLTGRPLKRERTGPPPASAPEQNLAWNLRSTLILAIWLGWNNTWQFAVAGVSGILVHELGHALTINAFGLGPSRIHLVPFFGGLATQPKPSPTQMRSVLISLAGPAFGLLAAIPFFVMYGVTNVAAWRDGVIFIAAINMLNLFPARPLDGARAIGPVLRRIHPWVELSVAGLLGLIGIVASLLLGMYIIAVVIGFSIVGLVRNHNVEASGTPLSGGEMAGALGLYALTGLLCLAVIFGVLVQDVIQNPHLLD